MLDSAPPPAVGRGRIWAELSIVLALGLGQSAVYSIIRLVDLYTQPTALGDQTVTLNPSRSDREIFDLLYSLHSLLFSLAAVALVCYLLWRPAKPHLGALGLDASQPWRDTGRGLVLALVIGVGGIGVYAAGRVLGLSVAVIPSGLTDHWWTVPILLLSALRSGLQEEVVLLGYLFPRLGQLGWRSWPTILAVAALRGSYHLYQGIPGFIGNFVMGVVFGWLFTRIRRTVPFVIAHAVIDSAVFIGYPLVAALWPSLFGLPAPQPR